MHEQMRLENCGDGALADLFEEALPAVLADLRDAAKVADEARKITLTITFKRMDDDPAAPIELLVGSSVKLAKRKQRQSFAAITHDGKIVQHLVAQTPLFPASIEGEKEEEQETEELDARRLGVVNGKTEGETDAK